MSSYGTHEGHGDNERKGTINFDTMPTNGMYRTGSIWRLRYPWFGSSRRCSLEAGDSRQTVVGQEKSHQGYENTSSLREEK